MMVQSLWNWKQYHQVKNLIPKKNHQLLLPLNQPSSSVVLLKMCCSSKFCSALLLIVLPLNFTFCFVCLQKILRCRTCFHICEILARKVEVEAPDIKWEVARAQPWHSECWPSARPPGRGWRRWPCPTRWWTPPSSCQSAPRAPWRACSQSNWWPWTAESCSLTPTTWATGCSVKKKPN